MTRARRKTTGRQRPWSYSVGERGRNRVRAFEYLPTNRIYLEVYEPVARGMKPRIKRVSLGHNDRELGKAAAEALSAQLRAENAATGERLTLQGLFDIYAKEVTPTKGRGKQQHDRTTMRLMLEAFGADRDPLTLGLRDWNRFIAERKSGRLAPAGPKGRTGRKAISNRQIGYDLTMLRAVLRWATMAGDGNGGALLERNPCAGYPIPSESSPRRPRMPEERYQAMLAVAGEVHPEFGLALVLANETGHRLSSIRQLWWSDILWDASDVRWRGETDKEGAAHSTPLTGVALEALATARDQDGTIGNTWVFPEQRRTPGRVLAGPRSRHTFAKWWREAEGRAGLAHDDRWGWHSLRRKFASELRNAPLRDVCDLGGWKSSATVLTCYQTPDPVSMRRALASRNDGQSAAETVRVRLASSPNAKPA